MFCVLRPFNFPILSIPKNFPFRALHDRGVRDVFRERNFSNGTGTKCEGKSNILIDSSTIRIHERWESHRECFEIEFCWRFWCVLESWNRIHVLVLRVSITSNSPFCFQRRFNSEKLFFISKKSCFLCVFFLPSTVISLCLSEMNYN